MTDKKYYIDVKRDSSLENRFYEAVKTLATETGSLNKRLFNSYYNFLFPIYSEHFKENDLREKLAYVENIFKDNSKCTYYKHFRGGYLHCHWKESKQIAENIFYIYETINAMQKNK